MCGSNSRPQDWVTCSAHWASQVPLNFSLWRLRWLRFLLPSLIVRQAHCRDYWFPDTLTQYFWSWCENLVSEAPHMGMINQEKAQLAGMIRVFLDAENGGWLFSREVGPGEHPLRHREEKPRVVKLSVHVFHVGYSTEYVYWGIRRGWINRDFPYVVSNEEKDKGGCLQST